MNSLESSEKIDFWNLNNGITILTSSATLYDDIIETDNIQNSKMDYKPQIPFSTIFQMEEQILPTVQF